MGDYSVLRIGEKEVLFWKWEIPGSRDLFLNFIFHPDDKKIYEVKYDDDNDKFFSCCYETTVLAVKKRLDKFHFTVPEIEKTVSYIADIPLRKIELAMMDDDEFFDKFHPLYEKAEEEDDEEKLAEWESLQDEKDELDKKIAICNLGYFPLLRNIREILDNSNDNEIVKLDMEEVLSEDSPDKFDDIEVVTDFYNTSVRLNQSYLEKAKVHFTEFNFDLVHIELIIALENATKSYFKKKCLELSKNKKSPVNFEKMVKNISLIDLIKFVIGFVGNVKLDSSLIQEVEKTYNKRNNIIHNRARRFKVTEVMKSIESVEQMLNIINELT